MADPTDVDAGEDRPPARPAVPRRSAVRIRRRGVRDKDAFRVGAVLGRGLSIWAANAPAILGLSALIFLPLFLYYTWAHYVEPAHVGTRVYQLVDNQGHNILGFVLSATLIYATVQRLLGRPARLGRSFTYGLSRFFPVFGVSIVMGVVLMVIAFGAMLVVGIPVALAGGAEAMRQDDSLTNLAVGAVVAVPVLYMFSSLFVAVPVCVVERPGVLASIGRSRYLTQGFRGKLFVLAVVYILMGTALGAVVGLFFGSLAPRALVLAVVGLQAVLMSVAGVVTAVAYNDLRTAVDGANTEEIAAIFE